MSRTLSSCRGACTFAELVGSPALTPTGPCSCHSDAHAAGPALQVCHPRPTTYDCDPQVPSRSQPQTRRPSSLHDPHSQLPSAPPPWEPAFHLQVLVGMLPGHLSTWRESVLSLHISGGAPCLIPTHNLFSPPNLPAPLLLCPGCSRLSPTPCVHVPHEPLLLSHHPVSRLIPSPRGTLT